MTSDPTRRATFVLSDLEKKLLVRIADRLPRWVLPDHLTLFGMFGSALVTAGYLLSNQAVWWLWVANLGFFINWFGDSLDGTTARVRKIQRPRSMQYVAKRTKCARLHASILRKLHNSRYQWHRFDPQMRPRKRLVQRYTLRQRFSKHHFVPILKGNRGQEIAITT